MTRLDSAIFQETLRCLPYHGVSLIQFAKKINLNPHTIYNYINGQMPSNKSYKYIMYVIQRDHYAAFMEGAEIAKTKFYNEFGVYINGI